MRKRISKARKFLFGRYEGQQIKSAPLSYLEWAMENVTFSHDEHKLVVEEYDSVRKSLIWPTKAIDV